MSFQPRASTPRLRSIGQADPGADIADIAYEVVRRAKAIRNTTQAGTYLLADCDGHVYILQECSGTTARFVDRNPGMLVGLYSDYRLTEQQIRDDLVSHFAEICDASIPWMFREVIYAATPRGIPA